MVTKSSKYRKQKQAKLQTIIIVVVFAIVFLGPILFLAYHNIQIGEKRVELENQAQELQGEINDIISRSIELEIELDENNTVEFQEKTLREQGLYKKEGEEVVTILPADVQIEEEIEETQRKWWNPFTW